MLHTISVPSIAAIWGSISLIFIDVVCFLWSVSEDKFPCPWFAELLPNSPIWARNRLPFMTAEHSYVNGHKYKVCMLCVIQAVLAWFYSHKLWQSHLWWSPFVVATVGYFQWQAGRQMAEQGRKEKEKRVSGWQEVEQEMVGLDGICICQILTMLPIPFSLILHQKNS